MSLQPRPRLPGELPPSVRPFLIRQDERLWVDLCDELSFHPDIMASEFAALLAKASQRGLVTVRVGDEVGVTYFELASRGGDYFRLVFDSDSGLLQGIVDLRNPNSNRLAN